MSIRAGPLPLPRVSVKLVIIGCGRTRESEGIQGGEDRFSTNSKSSVIFGLVFVFDHGHFVAHCDANIGMKPKALPQVKR